MARKRVMISYSHMDWEFVELIEKALVKAKIDIWRDPLLMPGDRWLNVILDEIDRSDHLLLMLSPDSLTSKFVGIEEFFARAKDKIEGKAGFIIPILVAPCKDLLPDDIKKLQYIDLTNRARFDDDVQFLVRTIVGSRRRALEDSRHASERNVRTMIVTIILVRCSCYLFTASFRNVDLSTLSIVLCLDLIFGIASVFGIVTGMELGSLSLICLSGVALFLNVAPVIRMIYF